MTAAESQELGRLAGVLDRLIAQVQIEHTDHQRAHAENVKALADICTELSEIREHGTSAAANVALELMNFKRDEHRPLVVRVESLEDASIAEGAIASLKQAQRTTNRWLITMSIGIAGTIAGVIFNAIRVWKHF